MTAVREMIEKEASPYEVFNKAKIAARGYVEWLKEKGKISHSAQKEGNVPSIHVIGRTLAEVWENTTMALLAYGQEVHTGYDPVDKDGNYISFPSLEGSVMMHIEEPFGEPRFHKNYLGGWLGFGDYKAELEGVKDHWMLSPETVVKMMKEGKFDEIKSNKKWKYTYHQRLFNYPYIDIEGNYRTINQMDSLLRKLAKEPLSKSAQAVTWDPRWDHNGEEIGVKWDDYDSPCLQRLWFRLVPNKDGKGYTLNFNTNWRSRDHLKAVPQNIFAVTETFYEHVRKELEKRLGTEIKQGRYLDISDSLHLYGHYLDYSKGQKGVVSNDALSYLEGIFRVVNDEPLEKRVIMPGTDMYEMMMEDIEKEYNHRKNNPSEGLNQ